MNKTEILAIIAVCDSVYDYMAEIDYNPENFIEAIPELTAAFPKVANMADIIADAKQVINWMNCDTFTTSTDNFYSSSFYDFYRYNRIKTRDFSELIDVASVIDDTEMQVEINENGFTTVSLFYLDNMEKAIYAMHDIMNYADAYTSITKHENSIVFEYPFLRGCIEIVIDK